MTKTRVKVEWLTSDIPAPRVRDSDASDSNFSIALVRWDYGIDPFSSGPYHI